ncbi:uncharacterized protein LOC111702400, partial [Eurytemora carolleeae]|uniref:uncharacterized protein LOC111702400 n=1 Tax=Eurytemora carolleeae TaxID=1294199 RepID=UPI000C794B36
MFSYEHPEGFDRQPSKEETLWQNEIKEVIWLELQAWFAGRTLADQDKWLISEREKVDDLANLVSSFRFSGGGEDLSRRSSSCAVMRNSEIGFEHQTSSSNSGLGFEHQTSSSNSGIGFEHQTSSSSSASVQDIFYDALDTVTRHSTDTGVSGQNLEAALSKLGLSSNSTTSGLTSSS